MPAPEPQADLCIVGAGIAGLNALHSSLPYLLPGARVVLIDRRPASGGMWRDTYSYVRLHQPHPMFTVGDIPWAWKRPRGHLAAGAEVLAHLESCFDEIRAAVSLDERFGTECLSIEERGSGVELRLRPEGRDEETLLARRVIDARGFDVPAMAPLALSTGMVRSVTPENLTPNSPSPLLVVGGGKTGMDTALAALRADPGRDVTLLAGTGTVFASRDLSLPDGWPRWWRGKLLLPTFRDLAMHFDGTNAGEVFAHFRETYTVSPTPDGKRFLFGLMSAEESRVIADGARIVRDYLQDVADTAQGPVAKLRSGRTLLLAPGTEVVNCTGYVLRAERPYAPFLSPGGAVLTITPRSAVHFLTSVAAYFLPHLFLTDRLREAPLYELDLDALRRIDPQLLHITGVTHTFLNTLVMIRELPFRVLNDCGLDLDRWFPLHRRFAALVDMKLNHDRYTDHARRALDRVAAEHGIACGPLAAAA